MSSNYSIQVSSLNTMLSKRGLLPGGAAQKFLTNRVIQISDPYVPMKNSILKTNVSVAFDGTWFEYNSPYARYHWYGLLMTGPAPKQLTAIPMEYNGAPMRGPKWTERAWFDHGESVLREIQLFIERGNR